MIWSLQILRFIAAAMVAYVHAAETALYATGSVGLIPYKVAGLGLTGVDIFFVISGVVIARTAPRLTPGQFAWRRIRRIVPLYLLCCIPAVIVAIPSGFGWRELLATFLLWPSTDVITAPLLGIAWTLSFEMLFYASAAMVLFNRWWAVAFLVVFLTALCLRAFGPVFQFVGNPIVFEFLFGVAIAYTPRSRFSIAFVLIGIALLLAAGLLGLGPAGDTLDFLRGGDNLRRVLVCGVPAAMIVYGAMQIEAAPSTWTYLGDASYALYLTHTFIITPLLALWIRFPIPADAIIALGMTASMIFAWRVHELIEKPILARLGRLARPKTAMSITEAAS
jgi:exopolysaccharide production protein ExoZ